MSVNINELLGKTIVGVIQDEYSITFTTSDKEIYLMYHEQDCCERVVIDDIEGELSDLIDSPILQAEESSNTENPKMGEYRIDDSCTWTFYKLATLKGYVTIRWYGVSNGYYSETVKIIKR